MRVHERGVGETRSCGTGTVAAAVAALAHAGRSTGALTVRVPGGEVIVTVTEATSYLRGPVGVCWRAASWRRNGGGRRALNSDARPRLDVHHRATAHDHSISHPTSTSTGELALEDRAALRRVAGLSTELADVTEVEYRQLRLERVVLVGVWTEGSAADAEASLAELAALAETAGSEVLEALIQRRDKPDAVHLHRLRQGRTSCARSCVATGADTVICDGELSPAQLNALEKVVKVKVIDRTALILDIFAQHATSREGKAQVALAQMEYMLPRLRGWGESMSRQAGGRAGGSGGGVGTRGPGETKIETDRRRIRERMAKLRREIKDMKKARDTQRGRRGGSDVPSVAIVGYTNAGKSSLLNALTGAGVLVENALFATLEPTTRRGEFDDGRPFVLTDTVGFVRHLPTSWSRRSGRRWRRSSTPTCWCTSSTAPMSTRWPRSTRCARSSTRSSPSRRRTAAGAVGGQQDRRRGRARRWRKLRRALPDAVFVSARTGEGLDRLRRADGRADRTRPMSTVDVTIPYDRGDLVARVHADGRVDVTEAHRAGHPDQGAGAGCVGGQPARVRDVLGRV